MDTAFRNRSSAPPPPLWSLVYTSHLQNPNGDFPDGPVDRNLPMQGTWVRSLIQEDSTCCRATGLSRHDYRSKRGHLSEKPTCRDKEQPPPPPPAAMKTQCSQKEIKLKIKTKQPKQKHKEREPEVVHPGSPPEPRVGGERAEMASGGVNRRLHRW